jgi:diguanylate cyclase (GGDEF)-like protein
LVRRQAGQFAAVAAAALTDPLTGVLNRRGFTEAVERELARSTRYSRPFVLAYIDARGLKGVNDSEGHLAGDQLLRGAASVLTASARAHDVIGRLGGDEFGILLVHSDEASAQDTAARLVDLIAGCEFMHGGDALPLSVAIGVGMISGEDTPETVMARADEAMYRRKAAA